MIQSCHLIVHSLKPGRGIVETRIPFATLEELFAFCVTKAAGQTVERLMIEGRDAAGRVHLLTFNFQSVTDLKK